MSTVTVQGLCNRVPEHSRRQAHVGRLGAAGPSAPDEPQATQSALARLLCNVCYSHEAAGCTAPRCDAGCSCCVPNIRFHELSDTLSQSSSRTEPCNRAPNCCCRLRYDPPGVYICSEQLCSTGSHCFLYPVATPSIVPLEHACLVPMG